MKPTIEGIIPPHITPFTKKGEIDVKALRSLTHFWLRNGSNGLFSCGSNGEAPYLTRKERHRVIENVIDEVNGKVPVIVGTGAPSTIETIHLTQDAKDIGVDAVIVITPYFFKLNRRELIEHYRKLINTVDIPIILYNVPKFTGYNLDSSIIVELVEEFNQIIAVKDSSGSLTQLSEIIRLVGDKINVFAGTGELILPTLLMKGKGAIVGIANAIPHLCSAIYKYYLQGDIKKVQKVQMKVTQLNNIFIKKHNQISSIKEAMNQLGQPAGYPRRPSLPLTRIAKKDIAQHLKLLTRK
jgi:4-hydroxy-tetrahydrodipicolinate synthase